MTILLWRQRRGQGGYIAFLVSSLLMGSFFSLGTSVRAQETTSEPVSFVQTVPVVNADTHEVLQQDLDSSEVPVTSEVTTSDTIEQLVAPQDELQTEENEAAPIGEELPPGGEMQALTGAGDATPKNAPKDSITSKLNLGTSPLTGSLQYQIPITVPPGRGAMTPDLMLVYSSDPAEQISPYGYGWADNIPYIERLNKKGVDRLYLDNAFYSSYDGELQPNDTATNTESYGAKYDNGSFLKYEYKNNTYWQVTDKQGVVYKFGSTTAARQDDPNDSTRIFRWMLEEVRDRNGNYIKYEYSKNTGQIYPSRIVYTGNGSTDGVFEVRFSTSTSSYYATSSKSGFNIVTKYRISTIQTYVDGTWARKYSLAYGIGDNTTRQLLTAIGQSGRDESGTTANLPTTTLTYQTQDVSSVWQTTSKWHIPENFVDSSGNDQGVRLGDINADGLTDILVSRNISGTTTYNKAYFADGTTTWAYNASITIPVAFTQDYKDRGVRLTDLNGDGLTDILSYKEGSSSEGYINNGAGWTASSTWNPPTPFVGSSTNPIDYGVQVADINGDGLSDLIRGFAGTSSPTTTITYLNNGAGWTSTTTRWQMPVPFIKYNGSSYIDYGTRFAEMTGDGLIDLIVSSPATNTVYTNNGSGWVPSNMGSPVYFATEAGEDNGARLFEQNGDGYTDLSYYGVPAGHYGYINIHNGASTWLEETPWMPIQPYINGSYQDNGVRIADIDGDGLDDILYSANNSSSTILNTSKRVDLLTSIQHPEGLTTSITYKSSGQYLNGASRSNTSTPFMFDTVGTLSTFDDASTEGVYDYHYDGGKYYFDNPFDRRFAGYATVTVTDATNMITKSYFHQGNGSQTTLGEYADSASKIGKVYRTEMYGTSSIPYTVTVTKWATTSLSNGRQFVRPDQTVSLQYDGDSDHRDQAIAYTYNANGGLAEQIEYGEVLGNSDGSYTDVGTDTRRSIFTYATNTPYNILSLPSSKTVKDGSGTKVSEDRFYYDSLALGSTTIGNLTKDEHWITGSTYASSTHTYNVYGLVTGDTDPRGKTTSYTYDTYNLYPATTTNALSQTTTRVFDYTSGKLHQSTDPNGLITKTIFDAFDRPGEEQISDPQGTPSSLVTKSQFEYIDTVGSRRIKKTDYLNSGTSTNTYTYIDGLSRVVQERREAEDSNYFNVKDYSYDRRGNLSRETLPYADSGSARSTAIGSSTLNIFYKYDPLGRIASTSNVLGTESHQYDQWKDTVTDRNGNIRDFTSDASGNLVQVDEHNGTSTYTTTYTYNTQNKLTKITDALGNVRNFTYDGLGRRLTAQDLHAPSDGTYGTWTYTYDNAGNLASTVDPKSQTVNYTYDNLNRPLTEDYTGQAGIEATYTYDTCTNGKGRVCITANSNATTTYKYSTQGMIATTSKTISGLNTPATTTTQYDRLGNQTLLVYPDNTQIRYVYNTAGQLERIESNMDGTIWKTVIADFNYTPTGQVSYQLHGDGTITTRNYDQNDLYRLQSMQTIASTSLATGWGGDAVFLLETALGLNETNEDLTDSPDTSELSEYIALPIVEEVEVDSILSEEDTTETDVSSITEESSIIIDEEVILASTTEEIPAIIDEGVITSSTTEGTSTETLLLPIEDTVVSIEDATTIGTSTESFTVPTEESRIVANARIALLIEGKSTNEKNAIKAHELASLAFTEPFTLPDSNIRIEVVSIGEIENGIEVFVRAWRGETQLAFGRNGDVEIERIRIINPPILTRKNGVLTEDPEMALKESLTHIIDVIGQENTQITKGKIGHTTTTVYPDAGTGATTVDGMVRWSSNNTAWSTMRDSATGHTVYSTHTSAQGIGYHSSNASNGLWWELYRSFFLFDTSSIPDADTINTATLSLYGVSKTNDLGNAIEAYITTTTPTSNNNLVTGDYSQVGLTRLSDTDISYASFSTSAYNNYALNVAGLNNISKSGISKFGAREKKDFTNTTPSRPTNSVFDGLEWYFADQSGTSQDPVLIIEHGLATPTTGILNLLYTYDNVGNITKIVDQSGTLTSATTTYTYDDLNRLISASTTGASSTPYAYTYTYDALGNLLTKTDQGAYTYAQTNYANPHAPTQIGTTTYRYDRNGNMASTSLGHLNTLNYRNRLTQSQGGGTASTTYAYDVDDARVKKGTASSTTYYVQNLYEKTGTTTTKYIYAGDILIATIEGSGTATTTYHNHLDHLGSIQAVTTGSGTITQLIDYYPFGAKRVATGTDHAPREYIGQQFDGESNLSYLNARYYAGDRGQFLSLDPVFLAVGVDPRTAIVLKDPQQMNSYSYARNNPIVYKDPEGELGVLALFAIGALANMGAQGIEDYISGNPIQWENYAGAAVGGVAGTGALLAAPVGGIATVGAVTSGVEELATQGFKNASGRAEGYDAGAIAGQTLFGGATAKLPIPKALGVNAGRNSIQAVTGQIITKLGNGTIQNYSVQTGGKMLTNQLLEGLPTAVIGGGVSNQNIQSSLNSIYKQLQSIQKQLDKLKQSSQKKK